MGDVSTFKRGPLLVSLIALVVTVALLPFCTRPLSPTTTFLPAVLAVVACFDVMSMWLLAGEYTDTGDRRMLAMATAYLWSLILMGGYALAFPGVFSGHPPLAAAVSVAPYLYVAWHAGFPVLLGAAWAPWARLDVVDRPSRRRALTWAAMLVTTVISAAAVLGCVADIHRLPVLINGVNTGAMTRVTAPIALPLVALSLLVCVRGVRLRNGPERWTQVTIAVCALDMLLTYVSRHRYSLGWYAGRTMTLTAAAAVLVAMLAAFRRLKAQAEFNAAYDALTGLPNRRSTYDVLTSIMARAHRMDTELTVVMFDLDHFKNINDTHGHAGGDAVLRAVAESMRAVVRDGDIIGRVGGEEFLIVLPDATTPAAEAVVDRLRAALRLTGTSYLESGITASFGIATMNAHDINPDILINRSDQAMYQAKMQGRDRIAIALTDLEESRAPAIT